MLYYVTHAYGGDEENLEEAKKITHDLQINNLEHCYVCPLITLSHLRYGELGYNYELALHIDILSDCDALIITGDEISNGIMQEEIRFARLVNMEVLRLEKDGLLRPFEE